LQERLLEVDGEVVALDCLIEPEARPTRTLQGTYEQVHHAVAEADVLHGKRSLTNRAPKTPPHPNWR
jgi:hypothetical protein